MLLATEARAIRPSWIWSYRKSWTSQYGHWEVNLSALQTQCALLTIELSLQAWSLFISLKIAFLYLLLYVYECLPSCMTVYHVCIVLRGQKRVLDPLGLELNMVVSHYVGTGHQT